MKMRRQQLIALALAASLTIAACAPMPQTRNTARELGRNDVLTIADEKPGSNNGSNNSSCCSSDPKGSSNSSSNKSVNLDDFRENGGKGPTVDQLIANQRAGQANQVRQNQAANRAVQTQNRRVVAPNRRATGRQGVRRRVSNRRVVNNNRRG